MLHHQLVKGLTKKLWAETCKRLDKSIPGKYSDAMKKIELYPTKAITDCFPWRSNPVINDWLNKGLIRAHHKSEGTGDYYGFTLYQIVHAGVDRVLDAGRA